MGKTTLLVLFVAITMINQYKGEPNFACTGRGGHCSVSDTCPSLGGYVEKLAFKCKCGKVCCKCTDTCPDGSSCLSEDETCDGMKDTNGCCGTRFCCTPIMTTTPAICSKDDCDGTCTGYDCGEFLDNESSCCANKCCQLGDG